MGSKSRRQRAAIAVRERKLHKLAEKEATKGLTTEEMAFFLLPKERRCKLIQLKVLKVYALGRVIRELEASAKHWITPSWSSKVYPPIKIHPFVLYVFRHLDRKHHGKYDGIERNAEFWDIIGQWTNDRTAADNIIGLLEIEREGFPDWNPLSPHKFALPASRTVVPTMINNYQIQSGALDLIKLADYSELELRFLACTHDELTVEVPNGKALKCPGCELQTKFASPTGQVGVQGQLLGHLRDGAERPGVEDLEQESSDHSAGSSSRGEQDS